MESKRQIQEEGDESDVQTVAHHSKRRRDDSQQSETSSITGNFRSPFHIKIDDIQQVVGNLAQKVVKEELGKLVSRLIGNETGTCEAEFFRLVFKNEMPATIFTLSNIKSKDDTPLEVALYHFRSPHESNIVAEGQLSSIKIELCVLKSELGSGVSDDLRADEFEARITRQREDKGKLLKGNTVIELKDGVGYINNVVFTDNSSWTRSRHFRLGARVVQSTNLNEVNIREGISTPFIVKDCRANQKHFRPFLGDEVWRLNYISKGGVIHLRLTEQGINTVGDLRQLYENNPLSWKKIFGNIGKKRQEAIIEQAKTSVADGQNLINSHSHEKGLEVPAIETTTHDHLATTSTSIQTAQCNAPDQGLQQLNDFLIAPQEEISGQIIPPNWPAELGQFVPAASTYADEYGDINIFRQIDQFGKEKSKD